MLVCWADRLRRLTRACRAVTTVEVALFAALIAVVTVDGARDMQQGMGMACAALTRGF